MQKITTFSTLQKSISTRSLVAKQDGELQKARQELSTGLRADVYKDVGFRAAQTLDLRNRIERMEAFGTSNKLLDGKLDTIANQMAEMRSAGQTLLATTLSLATSGQGAEALKTEAKGLLTKMTAMLNATYAGEYLFSGTDLGAKGFTFDGSFAGLGALAATADAAAMQTQIDALDAYFGLNGQAPAANGYSAVNYTGGDGLQSALLDEFSEVTFGVTADHEGFRKIFKALTMMAQYDIGAIEDQGVYDAWMNAATKSLEAGLSDLQREESVLGNQRQLVASLVESQERLKEVYNARVLDVEGVDAYEAATRQEALSVQLETSYAVTARLKNLSILNYL